MKGYARALRRAGSLVGAVATLGALGLTGCANGSPPGVRLPPLPPVGAGQFTGAAWRTVEPALGARLDPTAKNRCARGAPTCMDAVVAEMTQRLRGLAARCDHLAPFALMYREVSHQVGISVHGQRYGESAYVAHLDAVFATLYFSAIDSWRLGRRAQVPPVWRLAFSAAQGHRVSALGDMMLGMNAHISRDLPYALAAVGLRLPGGGDATPDVVAVNGDIGRSQAPMLSAIGRRFDPTVTQLQRLSTIADPRIIGRIIAAWRLEALTNALALLGARDAAERARVETRIDANATMRSLLIWKATAYSPATAAATLRDRYCASQTSSGGRKP